ncbi:terminase large subunit [Kordia sp.]|uniref:terminase large subunit n=1 Tax=Kordia sp. TaxID=1965332 RepID=UPI003450A93E
MQQKKIYITSRSTNIILEFRNYCWDQDKNGNFLETPIDEYNHAIDAIRYVFMELIDK